MTTTATPSIFRCRICARIAAAVFLLLIAIEGLLLIPSTLRFEREILQRIVGEADATFFAALDYANLQSAPGPLGRSIASMTEMLGWRGLTVRNAVGQIIAAAGEPVRTSPAAIYPGRTHVADGLVRIDEGNRIEVAWTQDIRGVPLTFVARLDSSQVTGEIRSYLLRIAGLVALIAAGVTAGLMWVLHAILLKPLMRLRSSMLRAINAPDRATDHRVPMRRSDELGEIERVHNRLLERVAESVQDERRIADERAKMLSHHDTLTGMPNRSALLERLTEESSRGSADYDLLTVFLVNILRLRNVNATQGLAAGDALIKEVGARLLTTIGSRGFVAYLGSGHFAVELRLPRDSASFAERLVQAVSSPRSAATIPIQVQINIGVAHRESIGVGAEELLNQAELALARAEKEQGAYTFFIPKLAQEAYARQEINRGLQAALHVPGELSLAYQPKASIRGEELELVGVEALLRWRRGTTEIPPAQFIPIAEATGLALHLDEWVLSTACAQAGLWHQRSHRRLPVAVNLSARQFAKPDLPERISKALARTETPAECLQIEITESMVMTDVERAVGTIRNLRRMGISIAMDDFGTGYSSLGSLRRLDVDIIKIDKSFIDDIGLVPSAEAVCVTIISLAQALGKRVVAEGVENERQMDFLRARGCDEIQGYLFAKPMTPTDLENRFLGTPASSSRHVQQFTGIARAPG